MPILLRQAVDGKSEFWQGGIPSAAKAALNHAPLTARLKPRPFKTTAFQQSLTPLAYRGQVSPTDEVPVDYRTRVNGNEENDDALEA